MSTTKGAEEINEQGAVEIKVETVDYRSSAGHDREPKKDDVQVTHLIRTDESDGSGGGGGILASAAAAVADTIRSTKDAISGSGKNNSTK